MKKLRFNRKTGLIYQEINNEGSLDLLEQGEKLDAVILWASPVFTAEMFNMPKQDWVQVTALPVNSDEPCQFVMNSGNSNALSVWLDYLNFLEQEQMSYTDVITRFSFNFLADLQSYEITFAPFNHRFVDAVADWKMNHPGVPMVDNSLPLNVLGELKRAYKQSLAVEMSVNNQIDCGVF